MEYQADDNRILFDSFRLPGIYSPEEAEKIFALIKKRGINTSLNSKGKPKGIYEIENIVDQVLQKSFQRINHCPRCGAEQFKLVHLPGGIFYKVCRNCGRVKLC